MLPSLMSSYYSSITGMFTNFKNLIYPNEDVTSFCLEDSVNISSFDLSNYLFTQIMFEKLSLIAKNIQEKADLLEKLNKMVMMT